MTLTQFQAMITKYGWDHILYIIFDNGRSWNCVRLKTDTTGYPIETDGKKVFETVSDYITLDTTNETLTLKELKTGVSNSDGAKYTYDVVNPVSAVRGLNCIPSTVTDTDEIYKYKAYMNLHMNV